MIGYSARKQILALPVKSNESLNFLHGKSDDIGEVGVTMISSTVKHLNRSRT